MEIHEKFFDIHLSFLFFRFSITILSCALVNPYPSFKHSTVNDDGTNYVTHGISNTNLLPSCAFYTQI